MLFQLVPPSNYAEALHTSGLFAHILKEITEDKVLAFSIFSSLMLTIRTSGRHHDSYPRHLCYVSYSSARASNIPAAYGCNFFKVEHTGDTIMGGLAGPVVAQSTYLRILPEIYIVLTVITVRQHVGTPSSQAHGHGYRGTCLDWTSGGHAATAIRNLQHLA